MMTVDHGKTTNNQKIKKNETKVGAATLSLMTLVVTALSLKAFSIMTF